MSVEHHFQEVYVQDGVLYAVVNVLKQLEGHTACFDGILRSRRSGRHWEDISNGIDLGTDLRIFRDPDHAALACVIGCSMVLQAADDHYRWEIERPGDWYAAHVSDELFFQQEYSTAATLYMQHATMANYFAYPFGEPYGNTLHPDHNR